MKKHIFIYFWIYMLLIYCFTLHLAHAQVIDVNERPVFIVAGIVTNTDGTAVTDHHVVTVTNETKSLTQETRLGDNTAAGSYIISFIALDQTTIVEAGDILKVEVHAADSILAEASHRVTRSEILQARVVINVQLNAVATTIHVPTDRRTIQGAIVFAQDGDTILVADGTYTGVGNVNIDFLGKAITVRSENGPEATIIDCENSAGGFIFQAGETEAAVLDGFTIKNGNLPASSGAGISCNGASPTIINCIIISNTAGGSGGGIFCGAASPIIANSIILTNTSHHTGGGIACHGPSFPILANCIIAGNTAANNGGAICNFSGAAPNIINCTITGNTAEGVGGGIYCDLASATVKNTILWGNRATAEGDEVILNDPTSSISIAFSDVRGGEAGIVNFGAIAAYENNIDAAPRFVDAANGGFSSASD